jgi:hypothetical protein
MFDPPPVPEAVLFDHGEAFDFFTDKPLSAEMRCRVLEVCQLAQMIPPRCRGAIDGRSTG